MGYLLLDLVVLVQVQNLGQELRWCQSSIGPGEPSGVCTLLAVHVPLSLLALPYLVVRVYVRIVLCPCCAMSPLITCGDRRNNETRSPALELCTHVVHE